jgi:hypothetical protein
MDSSQTINYADALTAIAKDIEAAKGDYPQLAEFFASDNCDTERLVISYEFRTGPPTGCGGWAGGAPHPKDDGVWFHIDLHEPGSTAQIHTQPIVPRMHYRNKRAMLLILEGSTTKKIAGTLNAIMMKHGVARSAGK